MLEFSEAADEILQDKNLSDEEKKDRLNALAAGYPTALVVAALGIDLFHVQNATVDAENLGNNVLNTIDGHQIVGDVTFLEAMKQIGLGIVCYPGVLVKNQFVSSADRALVATLGCNEIAEMSINAAFLTYKVANAVNLVTTDDSIRQKYGYRSVGEALVEAASLAERIAGLAGYRKCLWHHDHPDEGGHKSIINPPKSACEVLDDSPWDMPAD